jgi:hypothetical protein
MMKNIVKCGLGAVRPGLQHDFLRTTRDLPERGRIGIFNRS